MKLKILSENTIYITRANISGVTASSDNITIKTSKPIKNEQDVIEYLRDTTEAINYQAFYENDDVNLFSLSLYKQNYEVSVMQEIYTMHFNKAEYIEHNYIFNAIDNVKKRFGSSTLLELKDYNNEAEKKELRQIFDFIIESMFDKKLGA